MGGLAQTSAESIVAAVREARVRGARNVWLTQLGEAWLVDPSSTCVADAASYSPWYEAREECDALLLEGLFDGRIGRVHRAVLYDLASDAGGRLARSGADPVVVHGELYASLAEWKVQLGRHVAMFSEHDAISSHAVFAHGRLVVREVILGRVTSTDEIDLQVRTGAIDVCAFGDDDAVPEQWRALTRSIWMEGAMERPLEDADPLDAIPLLEVSDYHGRFDQ